MTVLTVAIWVESRLIESRIWLIEKKKVFEFVFLLDRIMSSSSRSKNHNNDKYLNMTKYFFLFLSSTWKYWNILKFLGWATFNNFLSFLQLYFDRHTVSSNNVMLNSASQLLILCHTFCANFCLICPHTPQLWLVANEFADTKHFMKVGSSFSSTTLYSRRKNKWEELGLTRVVWLFRQLNHSNRWTLSYFNHASSKMVTNYWSWTKLNLDEVSKGRQLACYTD